MPEIIRPSPPPWTPTPLKPLVVWKAQVARYTLEDDRWRAVVEPKTESNTNFWSWFVEHKIDDISARGKESSAEDAKTKAYRAYRKLRDAFEPNQFEPLMPPDEE